LSGTAGAAEASDDGGAAAGHSSRLPHLVSDDRLAGGRRLVDAADALPMQQPVEL